MAHVRGLASAREFESEVIGADLHENAAEVLETLDDELVEAMDTEDTAEKQFGISFAQKRKKDAAYFASQFAVHDWMVDVPEDLAENVSFFIVNLIMQWLVASRPEGKRCLVIALGGETVCRSRSGHIMKRFPSALPSGSKNAKFQQKNQICILDCVFSSVLETFFVLDLMCWKNYPIYDTSFEFRYFWIQSKLAETTAHLKSSSNPFKFIALPRFPFSIDSLEHVYSSKEFAKDGLLFVHKESQYEFGLSPLCLCWKDQFSSRYLAENDDIAERIV